jgi:hypothetical protein
MEGGKRERERKSIVRVFLGVGMVFGRRRRTREKMGRKGVGSGRGVVRSTVIRECVIARVLEIGREEGRENVAGEKVT